MGGATVTMETTGAVTIIIIGAAAASGTGALAKTLVVIGTVILTSAATPAKPVLHAVGSTATGALAETLMVACITQIVVRAF